MCEDVRREACMRVPRRARKASEGRRESDVPVQERGDVVGVSRLGVECEGLMQEELGHGVPPLVRA